VVQLADIARPQMMTQRVERFRREAHDRTAVTFTMQFQKMLSEDGNIFESIAERR
jgi:hypothetical protein